MARLQYRRFHKRLWPSDVDILWRRYIGWNNNARISHFLNKCFHATITRLRRGDVDKAFAEAFFEDGCSAVIASIQERIAHGRRKPRKTAPARPRAARAKAVSA